MGRGVIELGEDVSKSSLLKTSGYVSGACGLYLLTCDSNFITAAMMEIISEVHVFAEKTGLGSEIMEALIQENYGPLAHTMSKRLTTGAYEPPRGKFPFLISGTGLTSSDEKPLSNLNLAIKDVGHGIACAEQAGAKLKVAEVALDHLKRAKKHADEDGGRPLDSSSMYGIIRQDAGLDFETDLVKKRDA